MASLSSTLFKPTLQTLTYSFTNPKPISFPSFVSFSGLSKPESRFSVIVESSNHNEAFLDSGIETLDVPVLSCSEAIKRMRSYREKQQRNQEFAAMYSSITGGITTDTAAMVIPIDDHMVHRGHAVFDTAAIVDGYLYELDQHLNRIINSANMAKIGLPFDKQHIRKILIKTASASKCRDGSLRYWLTVGPGDFQLTPSRKSRPALYAVVIQGRLDPDPTGAKVITSTVPMKAAQFATVKSTNYLANALAKMEAEEAGAAAGVWVDGDGFVAEGPSMNVAFVTRERELVMPRFEGILGGCTAKRALTLAEKLVADGALVGVRVRDVTADEGKAATEMMLLGSGVLIRPVTRWDDTLIGDGKEGHVTKALLDLLIEDRKYGPPSVRVLIPTEV